VGAGQRRTDAGGRAEAGSCLPDLPAIIDVGLVGPAAIEGGDLRVARAGGPGGGDFVDGGC